MEVMERNILLRVGGRTLQRYGVLAVGSVGIGRTEEIKETFTRADATTCATYIDRDGIIRLAAANVPRIEWVDLDGDGIRETPGILLEGIRQNLLDNSDYEADIVGSGSYAGSTVVRDNAHALRGSWALKCTTVLNTFSGIVITTRSGAKPAASPGSVYSASGWVFATGSAIGQAMRVQIDWYNGAAYISTSAGTPVTLVAGWNRLLVAGTAPGSTTGVVVDIITNTAAQPVFDVWVDVPQFELGAFASSAIPTLTVPLTRAADSLTLPFNFGPMDLTALARMARPIHADASGDLGSEPQVYRISTTSPVIRGNFQQATRLLRSFIDSTGTDVQQTTGIPAGAELKMCVQYRLLTTGGLTKLDVGSGFTAESSAAGPIASFGIQTLEVGGTTTGSLYGVLLDLLVIRDLHTLAEALAVP